MTKTEAIDLLDNLIGFVEDSHDNDYDTALNMAIEALESQERQELIVGSYLIEEPSCSEEPNKSEPLTDKEQRIFLAAMGREEKVCKKVDEECRDCREPYEDSLVRICHEITRKVKGALWDGK